MDLFLENLSNPAYLESTNFLYELQYSGIKLGLKNIEDFLEQLGNPHLNIKTIHVAGTNGKGSTAAVLESILIEGGYKVGCYTSPHLISFQERIRINHKLIDIPYIDNFVKEYKEIITKLNLTFFEATTGLAFKYFAEKKPDVVILECGLGGRLDSTNVVKSENCLITKIALDHQQFLGNTIEEITHEKAGIIFKNSNVFTSNQDKKITSLIQKKCKTIKAEYNDIHSLSSIELISLNNNEMKFNYFSKMGNFQNCTTGLVGNHQLENIKLALTALLNDKRFCISEEHIRKGFKNLKWLGRLQLLQKNPALIMDAGHNPDGFTKSLQTVKKNCRGKLCVVCGIVNDKNAKEIAEVVEQYADTISLVNFKSNRALLNTSFSKYFKNKQTVEKCTNNVFNVIENKIKNSDKNDTILLIGSHYLAGEFLNQWIKIKKAFASYYQTN